jgi:hypothetical protein
MGIPFEIVENFAPGPRCQISQKYPQYHMRTFSTHRRVIGFGHPLNGGLRGYYQGNLPWEPWDAGYGPKLMHMIGSL